jgi:hypothetical protein
MLTDACRKQVNALLGLNLVRIRSKLGIRRAILNAAWLVANAGGEEVNALLSVLNAALVPNTGSEEINTFLRLYLMRVGGQLWVGLTIFHRAFFASLVYEMEVASDELTEQRSSGSKTEKAKDDELHIGDG